MKSITDFSQKPLGLFAPNFVSLVQDCVFARNSTSEFGERNGSNPGSESSEKGTGLTLVRTVRGKERVQP